MGLLTGLFRLILLALRLLWPLLLLATVAIMIRRHQGEAPQSEAGEQPPLEPRFNGPVYTVDYEDITETEANDEPDGPPSSR